jgi:hypothetical protein
MRKYQALALAVSALPLAVTGCRKTIVMVSPYGAITPAVQRGETVIWQLDPQNGPIASYTVVLQDGANLCDAKHSNLQGTPTNPAYCKVTSNPSGEQHIYLNYNIEIQTREDQTKRKKAAPTQTGDFPFRVVSCNNCGVKAGESSTTSPNQPGPTQQTPPGKTKSASENIGAVSSDPPLGVTISCPNKTAIYIDNTNWTLPSITFFTGVNMKDWSVTFDPKDSRTVCPNLTNTNSYCELDKPTSGTQYTYEVHATECSSTDAQGSVTVP